MISFRGNFSSFVCSLARFPLSITLSQHLSRAFSNLPSPEHNTTVKETVLEDQTSPFVEWRPPSLHPVFLLCRGLALSGFSSFLLLCYLLCLISNFVVATARAEEKSPFRSPPVESPHHARPTERKGSRAASRSLSSSAASALTCHATPVAPFRARPHFGPLEHNNFNAAPSASALSFLTEAAWSEVLYISVAVQEDKKNRQSGHNPEERKNEMPPVRSRSFDRRQSHPKRGISVTDFSPPLLSCDDTRHSKAVKK